MILPILALFASTVAAPETYTYWIEPCTDNQAGCTAEDADLAQWALQAWQKASQGSLEFTPSSFSKARIRLYWASNGNRGLYGEARPILVDGKAGAEVYIRPDLSALGERIQEAGEENPLFRHAVVYLTCLHETGHAIGMNHTRSFADIMYSFQYGGNIQEYFARYSRKLHRREDIRQYSGISADDQKHLAALFRSK